MQVVRAQFVTGAATMPLTLSPSKGERSDQLPLIPIRQAQGRLREPQDERMDSARAERERSLGPHLCPVADARDGEG